MDTQCQGSRPQAAFPIGLLESRPSEAVLPSPGIEKVEALPVEWECSQVIFLTLPNSTETEGLGGTRPFTQLQLLAHPLITTTLIKTWGPLSSQENPPTSTN